MRCAEPPPAPDPARPSPGRAQPAPRLLSLGPENVRGLAKNTGVMLMDVRAWAEEWPAMLRFGVERAFNFSIAMDQGGWVGGRRAERAGGRAGACDCMRLPACLPARRLALK